jgi:hypothetical protein
VYNHFVKNASASHRLYGHVDNTVVDLASGGWMDGPTSLKFGQVTVSIDTFLRVFQDAFHHAYRNRSHLADNGIGSIVSDSFGVVERPIRLGSHSQDLLELFAANITLERREDGSFCSGVSLEFRVSSNAVNGFHMLFESHPSLCICLLVIANMKKSCSPVDKFNMYSKINLDFATPSILFHAWIQTSPRGMKIRGSNVYFVLDARVSDSAGFDVVYSGKLLTKAVRQSLISIDLGSLGISQDPLQIDFSTADILPHHIVQRSIREYAEKRFLRLDVTLDIVDLVARTLFQYVWSNEHSFPAIQYMPSPKSPFVFFHIDKCAGTSIRK